MLAHYWPAKLRTVSNENPTQYITSSPTNSFVMSSVTETQVSTLFKTLDANKS